MNLLTLTILAFLAFSLLLYVLFAGADFGAGILGLMPSKARRAPQDKLIAAAVAPVWEANHMWLVLAVVILFMGFPRLYTELSTYLYIPLLAVLIGVMGRGCAFTFRHYDTLTPKPAGLYTWVFKLSSLWTAFFLGVLAGAPMLGRIDPKGASFYAVYVAPWCNPFCLVLGLFTAAIFALLAAIYLVGEARDEELGASFRRRASHLGVTMVALGAVLFATAEAMGVPLESWFFSSAVSLSALVVATLLLAPFWWSLLRQKGTMLVRVLGVMIVASVLFGWFGLQYPVALRYAGDTSPLTFAAAAAPPATQRALLQALVVGGALIFPALFYLLRIFKKDILVVKR